MTRQSDKLLALLDARRGQWVTRAELLAALYADREDGGANTTEDVVTMVIHQLRERGVLIERTTAYRVPPR